MDRKERILGCLYGGAAGDALGADVEFMSLEEIRAKYGPQGIQYYDLFNGEAAFTDDTQMLLFTLEGILLWENIRKSSPGAKLENCIFDAYRDWLYTQEQNGAKKSKHKAKTKLYAIPELHRRMAPGFTCISALHSNKKGRMDNPVNDSKGNGGVMRVAPVGFWFDRQQQTVQQTMLMAADSAALTHGHPLGYISAAMMAGIINECIYGDSPTLKDAVLRARQWTLEIFENVEYLYELLNLVDLAMTLAEAETDSVAALAQLGRSALAESALAIAIYCALTHEHDFAGGIITAANFDGDSDTVAAITGNILGARNGLDGMDEKWITPLNLPYYLGVLTCYDINERVAQ